MAFVISCTYKDKDSAHLYQLVHATPKSHARQALVAHEPYAIRPHNANKFKPTYEVNHLHNHTPHTFDCTRGGLNPLHARRQAAPHVFQILVPSSFS